MKVLQEDEDWKEKGEDSDFLHSAVSAESLLSFVAVLPDVGSGRRLGFAGLQLQSTKCIIESNESKRRKVKSIVRKSFGRMVVCNVYLWFQRSAAVLKCCCCWHCLGSALLLKIVNV